MNATKSTVTSFLQEVRVDVHAEESEQARERISGARRPVTVEEVEDEEEQTPSVGSSNGDTTAGSDDSDVEDEGAPPIDEAE